MSQLTDMIKALATKEMVNAASVSLGENETSVRKAFDGIMPVIMTGIINSKSPNHQSLGELCLKAAADLNLPSGILQSLSGADPASEAMNIGKEASAKIFDQNSASISNLISNFAGIKSSSSTTLLTAGAALISSYLGQKMNAEKLSFNSILDWLGQHQQDFTHAMPGAFATTVISTESTHKTAAVNAGGTVTATVSPPRNKWVFPLLLLALVGIGLFWWLKGCNQSSEQSDQNAVAAIDSAGASIDDAVNQASSKIDSAVSTVADENTGKLDSAGNWIYAKGDSIKIKLDNGVEIDAYKGSLEDKLHAFIKDPGAMPGKDIWFDFDNLLFETNKSSLKKGAERQLSNTCEILKAYPKLKIKLGAYTDNTGDSVKNVRLSESRAKTVYTQMLSKGITKTSFDDKPYEGYGPQFPLADNTTPEGRAQNRRISLSVRAK